MSDLRLAVRSLLSAKKLSLVAVLTLGLGIGANTVVFSIVNGLLLRPLPFGDATERVVSIHAIHPTQFPEGWDDAGVSFTDLETIRRESVQIEEAGGYLGRSFTLYGEEALRVQGGSVTPNLFRLLDAAPSLGRGFRDDEGALPGFEKVLLLSDGLWKSRFGADPAIVGRTVVVNERELEVVGVMPEGFRFPETDELWVPYDPAGSEMSPGARAFLAVGLLRQGTHLAAARAELDVVAERLAEQNPDTHRGWGLHVLPYRDLLVDTPTRLVSATLLGAVGLVLLVACANLTSLFLARAAARQREIAVRAALGAGRARIARQVLAEALVLGIAGGALGVLTASWGLDAIVAAIPEELPYWLTFDLDIRVALFVVALAGAASLVLGLFPFWAAWGGTRVDLAAALGSGRDPAASRQTTGLQSALVVGQIASSLALLVGAGLMLQSFLALGRAELGFDGDRVLTFRVVLAGDAYDPPSAKIAFFRDAAEALSSVPGVAGAAATTSIPADDDGSAARLVTRERPFADGEIGVQVIGVMPGFFDALDVALVEGRPFEALDLEEDAAPVAMVNLRLAERLWPGAPGVEREAGLVTSAGTDWLRIVGVAPDIRYEEIGQETPQSELNVYVPYSRMLVRSMAFVVRADFEPAALVEPVRRALRSVAPAVPAFHFRTMDDVRRRTTWQQRFFTRMFVGFAAAALALACLGTYGLVDYRATKRAHELGVRLALGARAADIRGMLVGSGLRLAASGIVLGLPLAYGVSRALSGVVYRVAPTSPWLFGGTALVLAISVLLASWIPARRATRSHPMKALRQD